MKDLLEDFLFVFVFVFVFCLIYFNQDFIRDVYYDIFSSKKSEEFVFSDNYYRQYNFNYVQNVAVASPRNRQDILNVIYSVVNRGYDKFTFYCPKSYKDCIKEVALIADDQDTLTNINNFVHPYNSYYHVEVEYNSVGKVTISIQKNYTNQDIIEVEQRVNEIFNRLYNPNISTIDNIKIFHDYIINNTKYDSDRADYTTENGSDYNVEFPYKSTTAYGPLLQGYSLCGGYSDTMELFLERLGVKSYKVSSADHVWNAVKLGDIWYNLDLTWDDPVANNGKDYLEYDYFLISTQKLLDIEKTQHNFNLSVYSELAN